MRLLLVGLILAYVACATQGPLFWPLPKTYTLGNQTFTVDPCKINYKITTVPVHLMDIVNLYLDKVFKCSTRKPTVQDTLSVNFTITVIRTPLIPPFESYENYTF